MATITTTFSNEQSLYTSLNSFVGNVSNLDAYSSGSLISGALYSAQLSTITSTYIGGTFSGGSFSANGSFSRYPLVINSISIATSSLSATLAGSVSVSSNGGMKGSVTSLNLSTNNFSAYLDGSINIKTGAGTLKSLSISSNSVTAEVKGSISVGSNGTFNGKISKISISDGSYSFQIESLSLKIADFLSLTDASAFSKLLSGSDTININGGTAHGYAGNDKMNGGSVSDMLIGDDGNDVLKGNDGSDTLTGGAGNDEITGGLGSDVIVFNSALGSNNVDKVIGFISGTDRIQLDHSIFSQFSSGSPVSSNNLVIGSGKTAVAAQSDDYLIFDSKSGSLYYDADGNGAGKAIKFATLVGISALGDSDFVIA